MRTDLTTLQAIALTVTVAGMYWLFWLKLRVTGSNRGRVHLVGLTIVAFSAGTQVQHWAGPEAPAIGIVGIVGICVILVGLTVFKWDGGKK